MPLYLSLLEYLQKKEWDNNGNTRKLNKSLAIQNEPLISGEAKKGVIKKGNKANKKRFIEENKIRLLVL